MAEQSSYTFIFTFGKYRNRSIGSVYDTDPGYIRWVAETASMPDRWRVACQNVLQNIPITGLDLPTQSDTIQSDSTNSSIRGVINKHTTKHMAVQFFPFSRSFIDHFKFRIDGAKWNGEEKVWLVPYAQILNVIALFGGTTNVTADAYTKQQYKLETNRKQNLHDIRESEDVDIDIQLKLPLRNYQRVGVQFVRAAGGRALIADQPGLGKTVTSIAYAEYEQTKTLIICPLSVVVGWTREIKRFTGRTACVWDSKSHIGSTNAKYHIIHYDAVIKQLDAIKKLKLDLMICDEATYLKNRQTKRSKAILGHKRSKGINTKHVILLTGTPILNKPIEAYALLNYLDSMRFNNLYNFTMRYGGWNGEPPKNMDELHERTKELVIRRLQSVVLPELPSKQRCNLYVPLSDDERHEYNKLLNELFKKWNSSGKPTIGEMPTIQQWLISKKLQKLHEMINEYIEQDMGIIIFCCYIDPLKKLLEKYKDNAVLFYGGMNKKDRQISIDALKNKTAKIGLFSLNAGAMGIDGLQHNINTAVFLDFWWVPAVHQQAEARIHRDGQTKKVSAYYIMCEDTIDEYMHDLIEEKQIMIDKIVDGQVINDVATKSIFRDFVRRLKIHSFASADELDSVDIAEK